MEIGGAAVGVADEKDSVTKCSVQAESRAAVEELGVDESCMAEQSCGMGIGASGGSTCNVGKISAVTLFIPTLLPPSYLGTYMCSDPPMVSRQCALGLWPSAGFWHVKLVWSGFLPKP